MQVLQILGFITHNLGQRLEFLSNRLTADWCRMSPVSLIILSMLLSLGLTSPIDSTAGTCAAGWLDGGATLGCIFLDNNPMSWLEAIIYCRDLTVTGVTSSIGLAKMTR